LCGFGVFGRIPITTTEATMPLSNCAKNIIRYLGEKGVGGETVKLFQARRDFSWKIRTGWLYTI